MRLRSYRSPRFWLLILGLVAVLAIAWPTASLWLQPQALAQRFYGLGPWRTVGFLAAHIVATTLAVPGTVLVIAGGAVFGVWWGSLWSVLGATLGAIAAFLVSRHWLQGWCRRRWGHCRRLQQLDQSLQHNALWCVLAVRFVPISPFNLVNVLFGLTSVGLPAYALGTGIGIIPGTVVYTWLGAAGAAALSGGTARSLPLALLTLTGLSLAPIWLRHRRNRQKGICLRRLFFD